MILVGLATDDGARALVRRAEELGLKASTARWLTAGVVDGVSEWVGVDPVAGPVNLRAPESEPGDEPNTWLSFADWYANTSDLVALRAEP